MRIDAQRCARFIGTCGHGAVKADIFGLRRVGLGKFDLDVRRFLDTRLPGLDAAALRLAAAARQGAKRQSRRHNRYHNFLFHNFLLLYYFLLSSFTDSRIPSVWKICTSTTRSTTETIIISVS